LGHIAQQYVPVYGVLNQKNKAEALRRHGKQHRSGKQTALTQAILNNIPIAGQLHAGHIGSKFQDLVDEEHKKNPEDKRSRKEVKRDLYKEGKSHSKLFKATDKGEGFIKNTKKDLEDILGTTVKTKKIK
jgi:hypothetical protein